MPKAPHRAPSASPEFGLRWLLRLRWAAVAGQAGTCLAVQALPGAELPWIPLCAFLGLTATTNLAAWLLPGLASRLGERALAGLLVQDTLVLAGMLWWTGGLANPFSTFFLLHVAIAAVLLPPRQTWGVFAIGAVAGGLLAATPHPLPAEALSGLPAQGPVGTAGHLVAQILSGGCVAFFVGRLRQAFARQQEELQEARQRSLRQERYAALATLAAGVAHELATPLSTIAVVAADLEAAPGEVTRDDAHLIRTEVERCKAVLSRLGARATDGIGDAPEPFDPRSLPERIRPFLRADLADRLEFTIPSSPGLLEVPTEALLQSLAALAKNACEADTSADPVRIAFAVLDEAAVFEVSDRGCGMDPLQIDRAGQPFFTTKGPGRGMGLGLFLVRTFAERVGGRLEFESRPGEGTIARLTLPMAGPA